MANGVNSIANLQGLIDANGALVVVGQAASGSTANVPPTALLNLQGKVDASNELVVVFV